MSGADSPAVREAMRAACSHQGACYYPQCTCAIWPTAAVDEIQAYEAARAAAATARAPATVSPITRGPATETEIEAARIKADLPGSGYLKSRQTFLAGWRAAEARMASVAASAPEPPRSGVTDALCAGLLFVLDGGLRNIDPNWWPSAAVQLAAAIRKASVPASPPEAFQSGMTPAERALLLAIGDALAQGQPVTHPGGGQSGVRYSVSYKEASSFSDLAAAIRKEAGL